MLRTVFALLVATLDTLVVAPLVTIIGLMRSDASSIDRLIRLWARIIVRAAGLDLSAEGAGRLDPSRRYIVVANHGSYLDIPVLFVAIPQPLRFLAKKSLFSIPIFGWGLRAAGFVPVDRKNRSRAIASFDQAAGRIQKGNSIVVFPEEGRSRDGSMRPFQRGAFLLALKSGLPLVPVAIIGTFDALPPARLSLRPGPVHVRVGEPIETRGLSIRQKDELMQTTRGRIEQMIGASGASGAS
ncbi:MAG TPA: lysophospholipid acyltransferase family protein [Thermoanaerobaculia bacterium]|nr:lysophospholipid acyltransferase family protein [Thermoanaerobaculia bacterium]